MIKIIKKIIQFLRTNKIRKIVKFLIENKDAVDEYLNALLKQANEKDGEVQ